MIFVKSVILSIQSSFLLFRRCCSLPLSLFIPGTEEMETKEIANKSRSRSKSTRKLKSRSKKIHMNFDFSDEDEAGTNEVKVKEEVEIGKIKLRSRIENTTFDLDLSPLAGSSFGHPDELPSMIKEMAPDAESTTYDYLTEDVSQKLSNLKITKCKKSELYHPRPNEQKPFVRDTPSNMEVPVSVDEHIWKEKENHIAFEINESDLGNSDKNCTSLSSESHSDTSPVSSNIEHDKTNTTFPVQLQTEERVKTTETEDQKCLAKEDQEEALGELYAAEQVEQTNSTLITALFQSDSFHNSSAEILASLSDEEKSISFVSSQEMGNFSHISASGSESDTVSCNDQHQDFDDCSQAFMKNKSDDLNFDSLHKETFLSPSGRNLNIDDELPQEGDDDCFQNFMKIKTQLKFDSSDSQSVSVHSMCNGSFNFKCGSDKEQYGDRTPISTSCNEDFQEPALINGSDESLTESLQAATSVIKRHRRSRHASSPEGQKFQMRSIIVPDFKEGTNFRNQTHGQLNDSSDDDDNFENFVSQVKKDIQNVGETEKSRKELLPPLDDFIVGDDELQDSLIDYDSENDADSSNGEDDALFYIKATNQFEKDEARLRFSSDSEIHRGKLKSIINNLDFGNGRRKNSSFSVSDDSFSSSGTLSDSSLTMGKTGVTSKDTLKGSDTESQRGSVKNTNNSKPTKENVEILSENSNSHYVPSLNKTTIASYVPKSFNLDGKDQSTSKDNLATSIIPKSRGATSKHCIDPASSVKRDKNIFRTPNVRMKAGSAHLMTAPRPMLPSPEDRDKSFFLKSLSMDCADWKRHPEAQRFYKYFNSLRAELTLKLFRIFDDTVFNNKIPETLSLEWNPRYTKTAGTFSFRQRGSIAKITLSQKVCDNPERVRDTLAHELCHAAVKLINGANESHGPLWKSWAMKVNKTFPFLPVVARCHDYTINTKYTYQCVNCKYKVGRHSKSLDTDRKVCGHCHGHFEIYLTKDLNSRQGSESYTPRAPNKFASYVKEHYSERKKRHEGIKHGDVMRLLSKEFATKNKLSDD